MQNYGTLKNRKFVTNGLTLIHTSFLNELNAVSGDFSIPGSCRSFSRQIKIVTSTGVHEHAVDPF